MENSTQESPQSELPKLKAFEATREKFALLGISQKLLTQSYPINGTILSYFIILGAAITFIAVYIFNYAETFFEYIQSIFMGSTAFLIACVLLILILKVEKLFEFINCCEDMLNLSTWQYFDLFWKLKSSFIFWTQFQP